mmetsp:Transcript_18775/g.27135  ORF Transcript_18775/g.27135 Transcript_18775/m.27135 type:complete len:391 (-) Transcript_18775:534-1706(-)
MAISRTPPTLYVSSDTEPKNVLQDLSVLADVSTSILERSEGNSGISNASKLGSGQVVNGTEDGYQNSIHSATEFQVLRDTQLRENTQGMRRKVVSSNTLSYNNKESTRSFEAGKLAAALSSRDIYNLGLQHHSFGKALQVPKENSQNFGGMYSTENLYGYGHMQRSVIATKLALAASELSYKRRIMTTAAIQILEDERLYSERLRQIEINNTALDKIAQNMNKRLVPDVPFVSTRSSLPTEKPTDASLSTNANNSVLLAEDIEAIRKEKILGLCCQKKHKSWTDEEDEILLQAIRDQMKTNKCTYKANWRQSKLKFGIHFWYNVSRDLLPHRSADSLQKRYRKIRNSFVITKNKTNQHHQGTRQKRQRDGCVCTLNLTEYNNEIVPGSCL